MAVCADNYRGKYAGKYALCAGKRKKRQVDRFFFEGKTRAQIHLPEGTLSASEAPHKPAPHIGYQPPQRYRYTLYTTPHRSPLSSHISYTPFDAGNLKYGLQRKICNEQDRHTPYDRMYVFSLLPADLGNTICNEPGGNTV